MSMLEMEFEPPEVKKKVWKKARMLIVASVEVGSGCASVLCCKSVWRSIR